MATVSAAALDYRHYERPALPNVPAMISPDEQAFLACAAERLWDIGTRKDALLIDAGCYAGASTVALAAGLSRSRIPQLDRHERIWSYDRFVATPGMVQFHLAEQDIQDGDSFRPLFERNVAPYHDYVRVLEGDIRDHPSPNRPIALLFLDLLWSWDVTTFVQEQFYPWLEPGRSLLVHQDFVYPYYPWIILSMGLLEDSFAFSANIQFSSVVFDVKQRYRHDGSLDPRNVSLRQAINIYDSFIGRTEGWASGALTLGKALYLASRNELEHSTCLVNDVEERFRSEPLVMQYVPSIRAYAEDTAAHGVPRPLETLSGQ